MPHALLAIRVKPRAGRNAVGEERAGRRLIEVTAPPLEGRATAAVCKLLARELGVGVSRVTIQSGKNSRDKTVRIEGMTDTEVSERFSHK